MKEVRTSKEYTEKRESHDNWLEYMHNEDHWDKTSCPMQTEMYNGKYDYFGNEQYGYLFDLDLKIESMTSGTLTVDRVTEEEGQRRETTWDIDVEMFIYKDYIYTISTESIHDAQTFTCWSVTRRSLKLRF
tara:strand:- start:202 stop:594 length:393 start_codon:yes stop_codon:yes gene_type:complete